MAAREEVYRKIEQVIGELKQAGLWKQHEPEWVKHYPGQAIELLPDFLEWLQFVYLPNRMMNRQTFVQAGTDDYITLQVKRFLDRGMVNPRIMSLLVELDSL